MSSGAITHGQKPRAFKVIDGFLKEICRIPIVINIRIFFEIKITERSMKTLEIKIVKPVSILKCDF